MKPLLDERSIASLRSAVRAVERGSGIPRGELVELQSALPSGTRAVIDVAAGDEAGCTLVAVELSGPRLDVTALTPRERQVASLIGEGLANKEIARRLMISLATVKDHVHNVLSKTGLPSRAAVAARMR